jgi:hypothetical protein
MLCSDGSPCLLPDFQLRFLRLLVPHLAALILHPSEDRFQLGWIRSSQLPPEFALDRGRDQVRFQAFPESCVSSLTCTSATISFGFHMLGKPFMLSPFSIRRFGAARVDTIPLLDRTSHRPAVRRMSLPMSLESSLPQLAPQALLSPLIRPSPFQS